MKASHWRSLWCRSVRLGTVDRLFLSRFSISPVAGNFHTTIFTRRKAIFAYINVRRPAYKRKCFEKAPSTEKIRPRCVSEKMTFCMRASAYSGCLRSGWTDYDATFTEAVSDATNASGAGGLECSSRVRTWRLINRYPPQAPPILATPLLLAVTRPLRWE
ncbi:hypothetical protein EVAR_54067_1 [Eumeta japonica]|uniref:Uncharacterized protein n=1 Tax=Eumeta variegata TaxID=151549 RepID=A0A4C1XGC1_EUMVA|nr:hypothetical protein EVAR_54067_1 [Eumeta japonica]